MHARLLPILTLAAASVCGQKPDAGRSFKVNLQQDSPLALVSADWGSSRATAKGGALEVEIHSTLQFRNASQRRLRGVSLLVMAQQVAPGGKASVTVPALDAGPGEQFPVRVDLALMRPLAAPSGEALVEIGLDGVLFDDLTFYGPDRLKTRRMLIAWDLEARRDRRALAAMLKSGGSEALRAKLIDILARAGQPQGELRAARSLPATNVSEVPVELAFVAQPGAPVELLNGVARLAGAEARAPRFDVINRSGRSIKFLEVAWLLRGQTGQLLPAGSLPAEVALKPGERSTVSRNGALRLSQPIAGMTGFLNAVEFDNGEMWIPPRAGEGPMASAISGEERRLAELYRRKGLEAVLEQLNPPR
jgi:hypothetical protein